MSEVENPNGPGFPDELLDDGLDPGADAEAKASVRPEVGIERRSDLEKPEDAARKLVDTVKKMENADQKELQKMLHEYLEKDAKLSEVEVRSLADRLYRKISRMGGIESDKLDALLPTTQEDMLNIAFKSDLISPKSYELLIRNVLANEVAQSTGKETVDSLYAPPRINPATKRPYPRHGQTTMRYDPVNKMTHRESWNAEAGEWEVIPDSYADIAEVRRRVVEEPMARQQEAERVAKQEHAQRYALLAAWKDPNRYGAYMRSRANRNRVDSLMRQAGPAWDDLNDGRVAFSPFSVSYGERYRQNPNPSIDAKRKSAKDAHDKRRVEQWNTGHEQTWKTLENKFRNTPSHVQIDAAKRVAAEKFKTGADNTRGVFLAEKDWYAIYPDQGNEAIILDRGGAIIHRDVPFETVEDLRQRMEELATVLDDSGDKDMLVESADRALDEALESARDVPRNANGEPVVKNDIEAYLRSPSFKVHCVENVIKQGELRSAFESKGMNVLSWDQAGNTLRVQRSDRMTMKQLHDLAREHEDVIQSIEPYSEEEGVSDTTI